MIIVAGTFRVPRALIDQARPMMAKSIEFTRAEDGCLAYSLARDFLDEELIHVAARWRDRPALDAHFAAAHMANARAGQAGLAPGSQDVRIYETDEGVAI